VPGCDWGSVCRRISAMRATGRAYR